MNHKIHLNSMFASRHENNFNIFILNNTYTEFHFDLTKTD